MKWYVIVLLIIMPIVTFILCYIQSRRLENFRNTVSLDELCIIFIEEDRSIGIITKIENDDISVKVGEIECLRGRNEIYPL